jgi:hypothetical protein
LPTQPLTPLLPPYFGSGIFQVLRTQKLAPTTYLTGFLCVFFPPKVIA